jgi:hypothetical protein
MEPTTIFDVYYAYSAISKHKNHVPVLISTIGRYLMESWGGQAPKGSRATPKERIATEEFLKTLPISLLANSLQTLEESFKMKEINKANSKTYKSAYKSFLN